MSHSVTRRMPRKRGQLARRMAALALAIGVPAFAAPSEWRTLPLTQSAAAEPVKPMGFETAGKSFPGSAFYYLADDPAARQPSADPDAANSFASQTGDLATGPIAARSLAIGGSALDKARALQCMTMAVYYEAATESEAGQRAVAQVVMNRVAHPAFPDNVCGVVFQGSERSTGCQFTFTCDGSLNRKPVPAFWDRARRVALSALDGAVYQPVGLATHYHTLAVHPAWDSSMADVTTIGAHEFFRWSGPAGRPSAFTAAYAGHEPLPAPYPKNKAAGAPVPDPVQLERTYEASLAATQPATAIAQRHGSGAARSAGPAYPVPSYAPAVEARGGDAQFTASRLPGGGMVKAEYSASGQWIGHP
jgi:spore germination cell wall hydrolase CwlJ-like protein